MNSVSKYLILLALTFLPFNKTMAQKASYETNKGMSIGFGLGAAYQQSDIKNSRGGGFDFNLGSYLYKRENAFLSADWKFRFLAGENIAHDHRENLDGTFSNIRFGFFNYDLELGLTLNRLREKTRIVVTGFAGLGITHGMTSTDTLDASGNPYNYSAIDPAAGRKQIYTDLLNLTDGNYETKLISKGALLPTAGIYLGYQFSRSFSMGIEHKINFSLTEHNSFSGINMDNNILSGSRKDKNHYTSIGFRWAMGGGSSGSSRRERYTVINTPVTVNRPPVTERPVIITPPVVTIPPPLVEITYPSGNTYSTAVETIEITARVQNVRGKQDIQVVLNNRNTGFDYNPLYGNVRTTVTLTAGRNIVIITGANESGSNRDDVEIIYNKPVTAILPQVKFINPASPVTVGKNILSISVQTKNVKVWQDVTVDVNGENFTNFNFSPDGVVQTNIPLKPGVNKVKVTGRNESGSASDVATITYTEPAKIIPPVINILNPATSPFKTFEPVQEIKARITGISGREKISLSINGINNPGFSFDAVSLILTASVSLSEGSNTFVITARNDAGQDVKSQSIIRETRPCPPPALRTIEPVQTEVTTDNPSFSIRAEIRNVVSREGLSITINNRPVTDYSFTGNEISYVASLITGVNTFVISAANNCGSQKITYSIFYKKAEVIVPPCPKPGLLFSISPVTRPDANHDLKGTVSNVKNRNDITITLNDNPFDGFTFNPGTGEISSVFKFNPGTYSVKVTVKNDCGSDSKTVSVSVQQPCTPPQVNITLSPGTGDAVTHVVRGTVAGVKNKGDIEVTVNGSSAEAFTFNAEDGNISANFKFFNTGSYIIKVAVKNECGTDSKTVSVSVQQPCTPPQVNITLTPATGEEATHVLRGTATNIISKSDIEVTLNGSPYEAFNFNGENGNISANFRFNPGTYSVKVTVKNECGTDSKIVSVSVQQPCTPPQVNITLTPGQGEEATHVLRGTITNVKSKSDIEVTLNGSPYEAFNFNGENGNISANFMFNPGTYSVKVTVKNECGTDSKTVSVSVQQPCNPPQVNITLTPAAGEEATHVLRGTATNIKSKSDIEVTLNGSPYEAFNFNGENGNISANFRFNPGTYSVKVTVKNECGTDSKTVSVTVEQPCLPPQVTFNVSVVERENATHEMKGNATNVKNKSDITVTLNDSPFEGFAFVPATGAISSLFNFDPGTYSIKVAARNECGEDTYSKAVEVKEKPCGIRINPGNSAWEFCLITPSGTISRDTLRGNSFTYSGPASSLFFKPIAGGGDALVNGKPYTLRPGQYYLFTGNLTVTVSSKNPGSMGQWSVCIIADREPVTGNGNNRPKSPCEGEVEEVKSVGIKK